MNDVLNLPQRKQDDRLNRIISIIDELKKSAEPEFDALVISRAGSHLKL
jgi:hypothetical protein